jgi:carbonic anhydrase/acetyltransferase-like protein (isoleucine patch superfamily)
MILPYKGAWPEIHETAFVAPSSDIIGQVEIGEASSIWFQCVIRGDVNSIKIGSRTNIQDSSTIHVTRKRFSTRIGNDVTAGHKVMLHGCTIKDRVLIGMGAIVMDGVTVEEDCMIGAGALLTQGKTFPTRSLIMGSPAKVVRELTDEELAFLKQSAKNYVKDAEEYRSFVRGPAKHGSDDADLEDPFMSEEDMV